LGDEAENRADQVAAGTDNRGSRHGNHRLSEEAVEEIRRRYRPRDTGGNSGRALAAEYGVFPSAISRIVNGKRWGWME
jgi:hypothetical protein